MCRFPVFCASALSIKIYEPHGMRLIYFTNLVDKMPRVKQLQHKRPNEPTSALFTYSSDQVKTRKDVSQKSNCPYCSVSCWSSQRIGLF